MVVNGRFSLRVFTASFLLLFCVIFWAARVFILSAVTPGTGVIFLVVSLCLPLSVYAPKTAASIFTALFTFISFTDRNPEILVFTALALIASITALGHKKLSLVIGFFITALGFYSTDHQAFIIEPPAAIVFLILIISAYGIGWAIQYLKTEKQKNQVKLLFKNREIKRWLHDDIAADLTSLIVKLEGLAITTPQRATELKFCASTARKSIFETRRVLRQLNISNSTSPYENTIGTSTFLQMTNSKLQAHGFCVAMKTDIELVPPVAFIDLVIQRCISEATTNIIKYAIPYSEVKIEAKINKKSIYIKLSNTHEQKIHLDNSDGYGLKSMASQMATISGVVHIEQTATQWATTLEVSGISER